MGATVSESFSSLIFILNNYNTDARTEKHVRPALIARASRQITDIIRALCRRRLLIMQHLTAVRAVTFSSVNNTAYGCVRRTYSMAASVFVLSEF